ncbi:MAG: family 43 glycosylhydrolase [Proteiniphilum sp.]
MRIKHIKVFAILLIFVFGVRYSSSSENIKRSNGSNPYMPGTAFIPDGEPRVFEDPDKPGHYRVYIYGSRDEITTDYCGYGHDVWSAPVEDLTEWTNHGEVYHMEQMFVTGFAEVRPKQSMGAPDCIYNPVDGLYYLYFFYSRADPQKDKQVGIATSTRPDGPFVRPKMCNLPWTGRNKDFDPSILVDEDPNGTPAKDGKKYKIYAYWGFGVGNNRMAELVSNPSAPGYMTDIVESTLITAPEGIPDYFEGPSIRKVGDKYVLVFSANNGTWPSGRAQLFYSYSDHPLGPWTYGGMIASNQLNNMPGGNDHGGIFLNPRNKKWYINYHRPNPNNFNRVAIMEPIDVNVTPGPIVNGGKIDMKLVPLTTSGVVINGIDAFHQYRADAMCYKEGISSASGQKRAPDGLNPVTRLQTNSVIGYMYMNFGNKLLTDADHIQFRLHIKTTAAGHLDVYISDPSVNSTAYSANKIGGVDFGVNNDFYDLNVPIKPGSCAMPLNGKRGLFIKFTGGAAELKEIAFVKGKRAIPNPKRNITIAPFKNGTVQAIPSKARVGESVKLVQKPDAGYAYVDGTLAVSRGVALRRNGDGTYEFKMPNKDIAVSGAAFSKVVKSVTLTTGKPGNKVTAGDVVTVTITAPVEIKEVKVRLGGIGPVESANNGDGKGYLALNPVSSDGGKIWRATYRIQPRDVLYIPGDSISKSAIGTVSVNYKTASGNTGGYDDHYGNYGTGYKAGEITKTTDGSSYVVSTGIDNVKIMTSSGSAGMTTGDKVTLTFHEVGAIQNVVVHLAGHPVVAIRDSAGNYSAVYTITKNDRSDNFSIEYQYFDGTPAQNITGTSDGSGFTLSQERAG